jgi:apolipoprotein N-acyltransferase
MTLRLLRDLSFTFLSSLLLVLSFPSFNLGYLAWIGLVPLMVAISDKSVRYGFLLSLICGMLFFIGIFHWILEVPGYTLLHHSILALYLGSYFGFFGLIFIFISKRLGTTPALFAAPFIWVSLEYIRSNFSFLALPWGLLGHSQYQYIPVIQIASLAGTYSLSFLIVLVNSALAALIHPFLFPREKQKLSFPSKKGKMAIVFSATLLTAFALFYGLVIISQPIVGEKIDLSAVQGNIEQVKKWDQHYAGEIMKIYSDLTQEASRDHPALIIWPETATPGSINRDIRLRIEVMNIVRKSGTYLLLGSSQYQKFAKKGGKEFNYLNSAFLISPDTKTVMNQRYDKIRLLPFGEYLPLKGSIPWSYIHVPDISEYMSGKEFTIFSLSSSRFGVTICWEDIFPDLFRQFVKKGAQFMVNITNEAWFGKTAAPYQFLSMAVFRAVENRVFLVRCANTGVTCIIDPYGRIVQKVLDAKGQDIFVRGVLSGWVTPLENKTFYTRYGDLLVYLSLAISVVFLFTSLLHRRQ